VAGQAAEATGLQQQEDEERPRIETEEAEATGLKQEE